MAKGSRGRRGKASRQCRPTPYPLPSSYSDSDDMHKNCSKVKKDWEDAMCSVCMECPHNAVLLLCSSHEKGCRPYMCGTSFRHSNCLDQYKKAYTKVTLPNSLPIPTVDAHGVPTGPFPASSVGSSETTELACPLCRGMVKGWTVVEPAREHLDTKKRSCMQDNCSFVGTYKELRKHVKSEHPAANPHEVDPNLEHKWRRLERERERDDVMSTIRSSIPGAVFFGDYVIEGNSHIVFSSDDEEESLDADSVTRNEGIEVGVDRNFMSMFLFLQAIGSAGNSAPSGGTRRQERDLNSTLDRGAFSDSDEDSDDEDVDNYGTSLAGRLRRQGRVLLGRSGRRRRQREANGTGQRL